MKKTLIALAVLAASGASFAQVSITGNLTAGYRSTTTGGVNGAGTADSAGMGVETSQINFAATEDLGGGMKAIAKMSMSGLDRSSEGRAAANPGSTRGKDASLTLITGAGIFTLASLETPDYLSGAGSIAGLDSFYYDWSGKVFSTLAPRDQLIYQLPMGAFTLAASYQENDAAGTLGLGKGTTGDVAVVGQSLVTLGATYRAGALAGNFTYLTFASNAALGGKKNQVRLSGSYDFGMAKLGLGYVATTLNGVANPDPKLTDTSVAVTVPVGAVALGASFVQRRYDDVAAIGGNAGTSNGSSLQATYALSKRTSVIGTYARWTQTNANGITAGRDTSTDYSVLLSHSF